MVEYAAINSGALKECDLVAYNVDFRCLISPKVLRNINFAVNERFLVFQQEILKVSFKLLKSSFIKFLKLNVVVEKP